MNGKEARERQKALSSGLGLYGGLSGGGSSDGTWLLFGLVAGLILLLAMDSCQIKVQIVSEPTKAEEKKKD